MGEGNFPDPVDDPDDLPEEEEPCETCRHRWPIAVTAIAAMIVLLLWGVSYNGHQTRQREIEYQSHKLELGERALIRDAEKEKADAERAFRGQRIVAMIDLCKWLVEKNGPATAGRGSHCQVPQ